MKFDFTNKKVIISGGSKSLGRALVMSFLKNGAKVCYGARMNIKDINHGDSLKYIKCDFLQENDILSFAKEAIDFLGGVDILINNVGGSTKYATVSDLDYNDWIETYKLNVLSTITLTKACYEKIKLSSNPRIVNISSNTALQPGYMNPHYSSSKAALNHLTKYLSNFFGKDNILVNAIAIGSFINDAWEEHIVKVAQKENIDKEIINNREVEYLINQIPLKRLGTYDDIVPVINMLSSDVCNWMTGSCIIVDGGKVKCM
jgi:3-oxoacyl-[acyl-carrier protein] reductase